jgi:hypothetical protein
MKIEATDAVIVVLHSPREKLLGILSDITPAGITLRSIELGYSDDWCSSIAAGEDHLQMSDNFFPMWRVERITKDAAAGGIGSMSQMFEARTGMALGEQ